MTRMLGTDDSAAGLPTQSHGSAVLFVLMVCLGIAVAVQAVTMVVLCARGALLDESRGRTRVEQTEAGLFLLRDSLSQDWLPRAWGELDATALPGTEGQATELDGSEDWVMAVSAASPADGAAILLSAWVEKGRDGVDLPVAALVAQRVVCGYGRTSFWLEVDTAGEEEEGEVDHTAVAYLGEEPAGPLVGDGCVLLPLTGQWELDEGWRTELGQDHVLSSRVKVVQCERGEVVSLPRAWSASSEDEPLMVVVLGGGVLDARGAGEMWGVLVVDEGSLMMEDTILHGAAIVSGEVDVGGTGTIRYASSVLAWARESSLLRVRLVPGSRREGIE